MSLELIDQGALHGIHNHAFFPWLTPIMVVFFYLGSRYVILALTILAGTALTLSGQRRQALLLFATVAAAFAIGYATQRAVDRPVFNAGWAPVKSQETSSFPSLNALTAAACYGSLALLLTRPMPRDRRRTWLLRAAFLLPFLTGIGCLYVGYNYFTDVLGGWLAGAALALACSRIDEAGRAFWSKPLVSGADSGAWFTETLAALLDRRDLDAGTMRRLIERFVSGECGEIEMASLLVALRMKGETAEELAAAASVLRERMVCLATSRDDVLDTCGTGGDGTATFNISTATALVVAGAGVPVVKHGNRGISSRSGSADVLEALGVRLDSDPERAKSCLERAGLAFCMAPLFHPALRHVGGVRRRLGVRTLFNCLGPLVNPARAPYQLLGVGRPEWLELMAGALARLGGTRRALLVCGRDGLDEVTLAAPTRVCEVRGDRVMCWEWTPADFGLSSCSLEELRVSGAEESARVITSILEGAAGPATDVVLANAAAALVAAERAATPREGVAIAREAITSGRAAHVLHELRIASSS